MALHTLDVTPFVNVIAELIQERRSGILTVAERGERKSLYWSQGELILASSSNPDESLGGHLLRQSLISQEVAARLTPEDPSDIVPLFHDAGIVEVPNKHAILRDWTLSITIPLFSMSEGSAAFSDEPPLDPEKRVFLQSMPAFVLRGVRSIASGLIVRRALGDIKDVIRLAENISWDLQMLPLSELERSIAALLTEPRTIESFLKHFGAESLLAARVVIAMMTLGIFTRQEERGEEREIGNAAAERDLALLAAIGPDDSRSLRAIGIARQLPRLTHYELLEVPRGATRAQVMRRLDELRARYNPSMYPAAVRTLVQDILTRVEIAGAALNDPGQRRAYDKLLASSRGDDLGISMQQRVTRQAIAEKNYARARELAAEGDYYGAIILLREAVRFSPHHADAWYLLGSCQERNPKWQREATESFQQSLSADPNHIEAMLSLGDLYRGQGLISRARSCYEDALQINPENAEAAARLKGLK